MTAHRPNRASLPIARQRMFLAALAFSAGIAFAASAIGYRPPLWWLLAAAIFTTASILLQSAPRIQGALALIAIASLGALGLQLVSNTSRTPATSLDGAEVEIVAHVTRDGIERPGFFGSPRQMVEIETESVMVNGVAQNISTGVRASIFSRRRATDDESDTAASTAGPQLLYGQRFHCIARLRVPHNYGNSGAFDYRGYLQSRGISYLASIDAASIDPIPGFSGSRVASIRSRLMRRLLASVNQLWRPADAALTAAMLLGDTTNLEHQVSQEFQRTGAYHILVVSGMNVGILAFVVFWLARGLRLGDAFASVITIVLAAAYAYLTDAGAPVVRAALMLAIYLVSRLLFRQRSELNAIGLAALIVLVARPASLFEASFQLTFLAVVAIAGLGLPLLEHTALPYRAAMRHIDSTDYDIGLEPRLAQFRLDLRMIADRIASAITPDLVDKTASRILHARRKKYATNCLVLAVRCACSVVEVVLISALMQLAMTLPMAVYFHRANVVALPVNVLIVPLSTVHLPLAALAAALSFISPALAHLPAMLSTWTLHAMTGTIHILGHLRGADTRLPAPSFAAAVIFLSVFTLAMLLVRRRGVAAWAGVAALASASLWIVLDHPQPTFKSGSLEITAIDVGQGDSILLVSPEGKTLLIDAGGSAALANSDFDIGDDVVSPYLWSRGIARLDAVALTHAHADHIGGLAAVISNFHPHELWVGPDPPTATFLCVMDVAHSQDVQVVPRIAGDTFFFGSLKMTVMAPDAEYQLSAEPKNNDSLVVRVDWGKTSALLAGDVERKQELFLSGEDVHADLLKVAHHGSATSTTPQFLAAVQPRLAVISAGYRNSFGHPRTEVLARLQQAHVATYRTDLFGATTFYLDGKAVTASVHDSSVTSALH